MSTPRSEVVAVLSAGLPTSTYTVRDFDHDKLGNIKRRTITVQPTTISAALAVRSWQMTANVDIVSPHEDFAKAEADLEAALVDVLGVLRDSDLRNVIDGAERIVRADTHHAWRLTLTLPLKEA